MKKPRKPHVHMLTPDSALERPATTTLPLREALFVYGDRPGDGYVLRHTVKSDGTLSNGKPLDCAEFGYALLDAANKRDTERITYLPAHMLAQGRKTMVWWRPAKLTPLWFKTNDPRLSALNGKPVPCPALVFRAGHDRGLDVWALAGNERPYPETPMMFAPFMNLMSTGWDVCLGTARDGALTDAANKAMTPEAWEHLFFESNFTHTPPQINKAAGVESYPELLEWLVERGSFPAQLVLNKTKLTLADVINGS